jgi:DNA-binding beta-propeller fold protein YncE
MRSRRIVTTVSLVVTMLGVTGASASPAQAEPHPKVGEFGSFTDPNGIAIDESSGDVYVADIGTDTVSKFDANGNPVNFSAFATYVKGSELTGTPAGLFSFPEAPGNPAALAVDNSTDPSDPSAGDLYVLDAGHKVVDKFAASGEYLGQITGPTPNAFAQVAGLAVDAHGTVFVDEGATQVREFDDSATNVFTTSAPHGSSSGNGFAVDAADKMYVLQDCGCFERFDANAGEPLGRLDSGEQDVAAAVDPVTSQVYVDDQSEVAEWDTGEMQNYNTQHASATLVSSFGAFTPASSGEGGIAVDGLTGEIYVANPAGHDVDVFGTSVAGVAAGAASRVTQTSVTLNGSVDPHGKPVTSCKFEYGKIEYGKATQTVYGHPAECAPGPAQIGAGSSPVPVSAAVTGLTAGTLYHFRLVAEDSEGASFATGLFAAAGPGFGIKEFGVSFTNKDGSPDTIAGSHPYEMTTTLGFNTMVNSRSLIEPDGNFKDLVVSLPPGLIANPDATVRCTVKQLDEQRLEQESEARTGEVCPAGSEVGILSLEFGKTPGSSFPSLEEPVYNMVPPRGVALQFGAHFIIPNAFIDVGIPAGGDYGGVARVTNPSALEALIRSRLTIWGTPQEASHDTERKCPKEEHPCRDGEQPKPFLTLPTACNGPLTATAEADSYQDPGRFVQSPPAVFHDAAGTPLGMTGCSELVFPPAITVAPDVADASTSTGLTVGVHVPQTAALNPESRAESTLRDTTVTLPEGVTLNPAGANGLEACSETLAGFTGFQKFHPESEPGEETATFTANLPGQLLPGVSFCPDGSKIGTVKIKTPLLEHELEGAVYLAAQTANPFGSLVAMYLVAEDPVSGTAIKLPGEVSLSPTGQIITTFKNTPALPFEELQAHFFGGERAPLSTPSRCRTYVTRASFTPWNGNAPVEATWPFAIEHGPNGGPCPGARLPFNPTVNAGATNIQAGAFSPLTVTMNRKDGEQNLKSIEAHLPPGLSGVLTGVELCPEPRANEGLCGGDSKVGEATVSVGVGNQPFTVSGGKFYLTGPYNGHGGCTVGEAGCAPFGLTFEVPAKAGPFDLANTKSNHPPCDCVVVRGKIELDPLTSAITITTNPPGSPDSIPTSIEGIPLEIQHVNATTTRGNFQFNPTNCSKMALEGTVQLNEGGTSTISTPFQVTNCAALKFEPKFLVSTQGKTSKANGASLTAKLTYPNVPQGTDADIAKVKVELPKQLPSRLTTLQKACTNAQFEANPAACPSASKIGYAVVHTPLIPVPLSGPVIFVSHGGEAFPSLTMVLQGYGITIDLVGTTFISKAGVTSTTFKTVPDQPFSSFELTLPEGPYSALTASGNLCSLTKTVTVKKRVKVRVKGHRKTETRKVRETQPATLAMPTEFVAQNGAEIHETTPIGVTGCAKAVHPKKAAARHKRKGGKKGRK